MRRFVLLAVVSVLAFPATAQDAEPYALPFASGDHAIELALDLPDGDDLGTLTVEVAEAPVWLAFEARSADATQGDDGPLARLAFDVVEDAPVGEVAEIVLAIRDAAGTVRAEHRIAITVDPPASLALGLLRPNPARGAVAVPYVLPEASRVTVEVVDVLGRRVLTLAGEERPVGAHTVSLDARSLAAGAYVIRLLAEDGDGRMEQQVRRLTVVR